MNDMLLNLVQKAADPQQANQNMAIALVVLAVVLALVLGIILVIVIKQNRKLTAAQKQLEENAIIDELTRIFNRRYFFYAIKQEESRARRYNTPTSCVMMDIDNLKTINETYGYDSGDMVLKKTAQLLKTSCRKTDIVTRFGDDEFMLILSQTKIADARKTVDKLHLVISNAEMGTPQEPIYVTASFGVADLNTEEGDKAVDAMLARAKKALDQSRDIARHTVWR